MHAEERVAHVHKHCEEKEEKNANYVKIIIRMKNNKKKAKKNERKKNCFIKITQYRFEVGHDGILLVSVCCVVLRAYLLICSNYRKLFPFYWMRNKK